MIRSLIRSTAAGLVMVWATFALAAPAKGPVRITGTLLDEQQKILRALGVGPGTATLGKEDEQRLLHQLDALGYRKLKATRAGGVLTLELKPYRVIRKIYIKGNWPIFEEEILRQLRFRPGQRLLEGDELERAIERQEARLKRFLSREGYFEGHLQIWIEQTGEPHVVNLQVRVLKGRQYKVGQVDVVPVTATMGLHQRSGTAPGADADAASPGGKKASVGADARQPGGVVGLAVSTSKIQDDFLQKLWFYKRTFNTARFKEDVKELEQRFHDLDYPGVRIKESFKVDRKQPASEAVRITLKVQQRKRIRLSFVGNDALDRDDLTEALTLYKEGAYDDYELGQSVKQIYRLYQTKGYLQARVHFTRKVGKDEDQISFHINEGPRYRVKKIEFAGNRRLDSDQLEEVINTRTFPWLGYLGLGEGGYVTSVQLAQDEERLVNYYRSRGYSAVKVRGEMAPHPDLLGQPGALAAVLEGGVAAQGKLFIRFTVDEGVPLLVEQILLHGSKDLPRALLLRQLSLKPGRPFTDKALALDKARLVRIYSERGHPYATVRSLEELDEQGNKVSVHFTVQEGSRANFGPVFVRGNFKTRDGVIRDDLEFEEGAPFDIRELEAAEQRLRARAIFNVVRVQPLGLKAQRTVLPVVVQVEERYDNWGELEFSVGGATDNLVFGAVAYTHRNLFGFGTQLTLKGEYGWEMWNGNLGYRDPRLFGTEVTMDLQGFARSKDTERLGEIITFGGSLSFSRELKELLPKLVILGRYEIRRVKHREQVVRPPGVDEASKVDVLTRVAGLGLAVAYDKRDNKLSPTEGYRLAASMLAASRYFGGTDDFLKFNVSGQYLQPLPLDMTIALTLRYDHGVPLGDRVTLPKVERLYAGGDTTIRGLEEDMALAERFEMPLMPGGGATLYQVRPQGGNIRLLANLEFRFPIWKESIIFGWPLMGALFYDTGLVTNAFETLKGEDLRHGLGAAFRLVTPVGFTSIGYAFCLNPEPWDPDLGRFHFNFGYIF